MSSSVLAVGLVVAAAPALAEPATSVKLDGDVEVVGTTAGQSAAGLIEAADVKSAVEATLDRVSLCGNAVSGDMNGSYKLSLVVDGTGTVTEIRRLESALPEAFLSCADAGLKGAKAKALAKADQSVIVKVGLSVSRTATAQAAPAAAAPAAAAPAPMTAAEAAQAAQATPEVTPPPAAAAEAPTAQAAPAPAENAVAAEVDPTKPSKPWKVTATVEQSLGIGAFVKDEFARATAYGYTLTVGGSYKLNDLLSASAKLSAQQQLSITNQDTGTIPREFYFQDISLGLSAAELYKEPVTGIAFGANTGLRLPTSKAAIAAGRILGWTLGGTVKKTFEKVGPGDLALGFTTGFRWNIVPGAQKVGADDAPGWYESACATRNKDDAGECLTSSTNTLYSFTNAISVDYSFLEAWSVSVGLTLANAFKAQANSSALPASLQDVEVGHSPYATTDRAQLDTMTGVVELGYQINDMFSLALGVSTESNPFLQTESGRSLRFPWFDFNSTAGNLSQFYFDVNFTY